MVRFQSFRQCQGCRSRRQRTRRWLLACLHGFRLYCRASSLMSGLQRLRLLRRPCVTSGESGERFRTSGARMDQYGDLVSYQGSRRLRSLRASVLSDASASVRVRGRARVHVQSPALIRNRHRLRNRLRSRGRYCGRIPSGSSSRRAMCARDPRRMRSGARRRGGAR